MKIDRTRFIEAVSYINEINKWRIDELDFSEFFDVDSNWFKNMIKDWKFTGLNSKDFIMFNIDKWIKSPSNPNVKEILQCKMNIKELIENTDWGVNGAREFDAGQIAMIILIPGNDHIEKIRCIFKDPSSVYSEESICLNRKKSPTNPNTNKVSKV